MTSREVSIDLPPPEAPPTDSSRSCALVAALNAEWPGLVRATAAEIGVWAVRHPVLAACQDLDDVLLRVRAEPDPSLTVLVREAADGSRLAARVILQALLGKLVLMARRSRYAGVDDFVAALWCRIAGYPLERRPRRIAANLALDTLKDVTRLLPSPEIEQPVPWPPGEHLEELFGAKMALTRDEELTATDLISAAVDLHVIGAEAAAVLTTVYVDGLTSAHAAARHRTTAEVIRYRCSRASRLIRVQLPELISAA